MSNFFTALISPNSGKSHKRVVSLAASATLVGTTIADIFMEVKIDPVLLDACLWLAIVGMGTATVEQFAPQSKQGRAKTTETITTVVEGPTQNLTPP